MKKYAFISIVVIFLSFLLPSCNNQPQPVPQKTTTVTDEKVTYSDQGFYVEQQTIVRGNTVWGISEKVYGTGMQWREIVALNPFLNTPDRLYYNPERKMWIVRIYPGEVLNIGGQKVYPSCVYESTTTVTTTEPVSTSVPPVIPWWGWVLIVVGIALLALLFGFYRPISFSNNNSANSSSAVRVNILNGIDLDTRRAIIERNGEFRDDVLSMIGRDSKRKGRLSGFIMDATQEGLFVAANYYERGGGSKNRRFDKKPRKNGEPKNDDVK